MLPTHSIRKPAPRKKADDSGSSSFRAGGVLSGNKVFLGFLLVMTTLSLFYSWNLHSSLEMERELSASQLQELQDLVRSKSEEKSSLQQALLTAQNSLSEGEKKISTLTAKLSDCRTSHEDLSGRKARTDSQLLSAQKENEDLRAQVLELQERESEAREKIFDSFDARNAELESKTIELQKQLDLSISHRDSIFKENVQLTDKSTGLQKQYDDSLKQMQRIRDLLFESQQQLDEQRESFQKRLDDAHQQLRLKESEQAQKCQGLSARQAADPIELPSASKADSQAVPTFSYSKVQLPPEVEEKRQSIKEAMKFAWDMYVAYAWGEDELKPVSKQGTSWIKLGLTIVDSIDTLYIMGLEDEYQKARDWIKNNLDNEQSHQESTFEITIRNLGGLLSIYELTKEKMFLDQAADLGERILKAFVSPTGYPEPKVDLKSRASSRNSVGRFVLAEVGTMQMEFLYLAYHTKNSTFAEKPMAVFKKLREMMPDDGLYPVYFDQGEGRKNNGGHMTLGAMADSFYEYELKLWLLTNKQYDGYRSMYEESSNGAIDKLVRESKAGHLFIEDVRNGRPQNRMEHLSCFSGGMFGLGSQEGAVSNPDKQLEVGAGLTETCFNSYKATKTGLGPEIFTFNENGEIIPGGQKYYILRPETVESLFVMWRLTHDQKYRDWGWLIFQAIEEYCRTPNGYSSVNNVDELPVKHDDVQHSFFMAETLKYLYLLFSPDDLIPLSDYVFNTEAHPLGIIRETSGTMPRDIHQHLMLF
eukprot:TRINITY_DN1758_c0_g2_i1.p1 TRINITY_DN1758_c0_g2~~TRINITY_DN1758_c0_g2_i1.p1  ORF type:complete len:759 (+),score=251.84 TRINITY_DN1758_c0_g2_i1:128-2404(+)